MRSLYFLSALILLGILYPAQHVGGTDINDKTLKSNSIYSVYELSPKTTAIVINHAETDSATVFDKIFDRIEEQDSIKANWFYTQFDEAVPVKGVQIVDSTGVYSLLYNERVEKEMKPLLDKDFYIYGTKGFEIQKPQKVVLGLDECKTNIFAFTIDRFDSNKNGKPIFASDKKINLVFGTNYKQIEAKINDHYSNIQSDYADNIPTKVYANIDNLYFVYTDDFKWRDTFSFETTECFFPSRAIFRLEKDGTVTPIWEDGLDLFGIPCD
ncbi:hypothetical protein CLV62_11553 [Dysgonomonas alginatilytica]|uniref:GLPGLI family protein n=1 Tax=Dysgonomonas alginatilytica TaxID=1605892 RepID=A0A2V3PPE6_9BACT|nr:hypothetical protein [Dysgonomonas alginatilytica]PXV63171.1 hypothetical protein CLV62_11553 [Dysgonomonas alginatilytica]